MTTHLVNMIATMMTKALTRVRMLAFNIIYVIVYSVSHSHECSLHIFLLAAVFHVLLVCVCVCGATGNACYCICDINRCKGRCLYLFVYTYVLSYYMYRIHDTDTRSLHVYVVYTFSSRSMLFTHAGDIA